VRKGQLYYYQLDQLGTPLSLTDSENNLVWHAHYSVFGKATVIVNKVDNPIRFQGQYFDSESGLHYNHFRYYDPETGRFISQDPIGLLGGINHYQYAPNHINWIDPLGLSCKENTWNNFQQQFKGHFNSASDAASCYYAIKEVEGMAKNLRPDPSSYLPQSYIDVHLSKFETGAAYFAPKWALDTFGRDPVGRADGQFVMSKVQLDELLLSSNGDMTKIEKELGIPAGAWQGQEMVIISIPEPAQHNIRVPTGKESGANELWKPAGKLPTGHDEATIDAISLSSYQELSIDEATTNAKRNK